MVLKISWGTFSKDIKILSEEILESGKFFSKIVAITRGGLVPAYYLADLLDIRWIDTIGVNSYEGKKQGKVVQSKLSVAPLNDTDVLIVDDLVDTGKTLEFVKLMYPEASYAVLYTKNSSPDIADFSVKVLPDKWIKFPWESKY